LNTTIRCTALHCTALERWHLIAVLLNDDDFTVAQAYMMLSNTRRLLDDNRELYVPELREAVRPHPHFMLFATQNPAGGAYAGRRPLSRAFRSRFLVRRSILLSRTLDTATAM
jgi:hypothetical protein